MRQLLAWAVVGLMSVGVARGAEQESVYAPPSPPREDEGINQGGVNLDLTVKYLTDYVYRGIDHSEVGGAEDAPNLQFDGSLEFDLGKLPHPFVGVFANVYDSDPRSRFQEIRPYFGLELPLKPFTFAGGNTTYIFPERDQFNTGEAWGKITLDDSFLFHTERPVFQPYALAAYDYDLNHGWYFEVGIRHDIPIENLGVTLSLVADVAYIQGMRQQFVFVSPQDTGFQHYDIGLIGRYSLNTLFNAPQRFGQWTLEGYLFYTDGINQDVYADTQLWGGIGIGFKY